MATTTASTKMYDSNVEFAGDGTVDYDTHTFICLLTTSTHTPDQAADTQLSDIDNEVSGNGYSRQTLTGVTWLESAGVVTFDSNNPVFTASGGSIVARNYHFIDDNTTSPVDSLVIYGILDTSPADVTTTDSNTLTVTANAAGWFTYTASDG